MSEPGVERSTRTSRSNCGQPIVCHHGCPLSSDDWDAQMMFFVLNGYRVVAHDRRGHGRSTRPRTATTWTPTPSSGTGGGKA
jgi:non-heme chloroperoxidase